MQQKITDFLSDGSEYQEMQERIEILTEQNSLLRESEVMSQFLLRQFTNMSCCYSQQT